jgi:exodeoxyribonuclease V beta subunit
MTYTLVQDIGDIDLNRHALIEASAGTGKTYTLEHLVVRLLKERPDIALENILMVTFTEKATSELKTRIQEKLTAALSGPDPAASDADTIRKIRETLDAFDTASIYTIHGFCHTVLKDFAFENGSLFQHDVIDDAQVFDSLMKEQMRKAWPDIYGDHFGEMLQVSGFSAGKERFLERVVHIARRVYRPGVGDELIPDAQGRSLAQLRADITAQTLALKALIGDPPTFSAGFAELNINGRSKKSLLGKLVVPLEDYLAQVSEENFQLPELLDLITDIQAVKSTGRQGIACLVPAKWLKAGDNREVCPHLEKVAAGLEQLTQLILRLQHYLTIASVKLLQADAARAKRENGWISYDDMLSQVAGALDSDHATELIRTLRSRYKIAFVDEFQDTDPVQWRIFKRLFLDDTAGELENRVMLIGDPKQAIYSFRGADVYAYLEARNVMEQLAGRGEAGLYSLAVNWRSKPELVAAFNDLFGRDTWFPPHDRAGPFEIGYQDVGSPPEAYLPAVLTADESGRPALNVLDLSAAESIRLAKPVLARFIASEIRHLVDRGGIRIRERNGDPRPLDFGDICLLVRGRADALLLEPELLERAIPYSFYKKPGLFFSDQALHLSLVCRAVGDPGNVAEVKKALLTPFFDYAPADLYAYESLPVAHPLKQLLFGWHELARGQRWGRLFQSLLEDSGLLYREAATPDWDRTYSNYRQICEHLQTVAYRKNLDFRGLTALLDSYRKETVGAEDDADIHQIETEEKKVQIMTMHVSKGLQFPVVFIAGGLTQRSFDAYHTFHQADPADPIGRCRKIIDLSCGVDPDRHKREKIDEDKRLYYVALTRAQFKLYLPYLPATSGHAWVGPVGRFVAGSVGSAFSAAAGKPGIIWLDPEETAAAGAAASEIRTKAAGDAIPAPTPDPYLPPNPNYQSRRILLESFSSLQRRLHRAAGQLEPQTGFQVAQTQSREDDEDLAAGPADIIQSARPEDEIPGGADIGSMFHDILEHVDFETVAADPDAWFEAPANTVLVDSTMAAYQVDKRWRAQVGRLIARVLTTPVSPNGKPFMLAALKPAKRKHEVEFYYPFALPEGAAPEIPECDVVKGRNCFIRGFVDLVFQHQGQFFIADWKSNRLDDGYGFKALETCMQTAGYHLQYKLYAVAVLRWLQHAFGARFDAGRHFGGVYYFFIRGMGAGDGDGVYFVPASDMGSLEELEKEIAATLSGAVCGVGG